MDRMDVVVGLGTGVHTDAAVDWAADEARTRGCRLEIVRSYYLTAGLAPWETPTDRTINEDLRRSAEAKLRRAEGRVRGLFPELDVRATAVDGVASHVLVDRSATAAVTVLGARNLTALGSVVLGSVSTVVAAAALGPVVILEGPPADPAEHRKVVAGVDGSEIDDELLSFAFDHASRHGLALHAVSCWRPEVLRESPFTRHHPIPDRAERWLAEAVAGWQEKYPDVPVERAVVRAHPVAGLVAASTAEDLLVVGARHRHSRFAPLLGSVSQGVLHHATCPVAIVHP